MSELSNMLAEQFKRWLIQNGRENMYTYYFMISDSINLMFLNGIKERNVFEVTNLQTIEKIRKNILQYKRGNRKFIEFLDEYVRFLIEQEHSSGNISNGKSFSECQNPDNMNKVVTPTVRSGRETIKLFIDEELNRCREEYDQIFDESNDKLFYERIHQNRELKCVLLSFAEAFERTAELFVFDSDLWGDDTSKVKNIINTFFANTNHTAEEVNLLYQEVSVVLDKQAARVKELWDLAIDDEDEEKYKLIRRNRKLLKSVKQEIDSLYLIAEKYYVLKSNIAYESVDEPKNTEQEKKTEEKDDLQQIIEIEQHDSLSLDDYLELQIQSENSIENLNFIQNDVSYEEMNINNLQKEEVGISAKYVSQDLTESLKPNLQINGNDIMVYDWRDVTRKVCEYAINAKPFLMANIRAKSVFIDGMSAFERNMTLNPAYIRLSNGLQVLGVDNRESCQTICQVVCEHCGFREVIEIK